MNKVVQVPSPARVSESMRAFDGIDEYDAALAELIRVFPTNTHFHQLLIKVVALNRLYSTQILAVYDVANHIFRNVAELDLALARGDLDLVEAIANVRLKGKLHNFYSFGSKFCAWHRPDTYPIYDSRVDNYLFTLSRQDQRMKFARKELWSYTSFVAVMRRLRECYGLQDFTFKQIDKFIWMQGEPVEISQGEELV